MSRRTLLLIPTLVAAVAAPAGPALAGEDDDSPSASLRATQGCVSGDRARATVTGDDIDAVAFYMDGDHVKTLNRPDDDGRYRITVNCDHLRVGAHRARAIVWFEAGSSPARQTLRFQITRSRQGSPRFAG